MKARKLTRVLITGKAIAGAKKESATPVDSSNEFDVDLSSGREGSLRRSGGGARLAEGGVPGAFSTSSRNRCAPCRTAW